MGVGLHHRNAYPQTGGVTRSNVNRKEVYVLYVHFQVLKYLWEHFEKLFSPFLPVVDDWSPFFRIPQGEVVIRVGAIEAQNKHCEIRILSMRKSFLVALILPVLSFSMGERSLPQELIPAKIVDKKGEIHEVSALICDGKSYFTFEDGSVYLKVPFEQIKKMVIEAKKGDKLIVEVFFKNGLRKKVLIDADVECSGPTPYGVIDAYLSQIKEIDFGEKGNGE